VTRVNILGFTFAILAAGNIAVT